MLIAALFVIAPNQKYVRCLSQGDWLKKLWYIHSTDYYKTIKRNKLWIHPELGEVSIEFC